VKAGWLNTGCGASALEQEHISPSLAEFADAPPHADLAKSAGLVQRDAGDILREDASLQRPDAVKLGFCDQRFEKRFADAAAPRRGSDIDGHFRNPRVNLAG
jgi:hypothetical protein